MSSNQPIITPDELAAKWSNLLNQAFIQIIALEKQVITLEKQLAAQAAFIQEMTKNEVGLADHIQDLEAELAELKRSSPYKLSQEAAEIATEGSAIIADGK